MLQEFYRRAQQRYTIQAEKEAAAFITVVQWGAQHAAKEHDDDLAVFALASRPSKAVSCSSGTFVNDDRTRARSLRLLRHRLREPSIGHRQPSHGRVDISSDGH